MPKQRNRIFFVPLCPKCVAIMSKLPPFEFKLPDFDLFVADQQFVNVVKAIETIETQNGGLTPEEIWTQAQGLIESLKNVPRPEITVQRMFSYLVSKLEDAYPNRTRKQIEQTAHCILFCANYILCANDEKPDPNQDIIDNISETLSQMPDIVLLFELVEQMEDEQEAKGHPVEPRNVLAKPQVETVEEAAKRIMGLLKKDIISPIVSANLVQPSFMAEFAMIWEDVLDDETLRALMRRKEFEKTYNLKLVVNILALMVYKQEVLKTNPHKLDKMLFPTGTHYKYFTTDVGNNFSAFRSSSEQAIVKTIIEKHRK